MTTTTALAVIENFNLAVPTGEMAQAMAEEMDGLQFNFDKVKVPSGGGIMWSIPNPDDPEDPEMTKELIGVIVDHHPVNAWWEKKYDGSKNPPDCSSLDGKFGIDRRTGEKINCASCSKNQWGSDPEGSGGKWCKNMRRVYLMREGSPFPLLVTIPPTSLQNFGDFVAKKVIGKGITTIQILTKLTLKKDTNKNGIEYSKVVAAPAGALDKNAATMAAEYSKTIKPITRTIAIEADDYYTDNDRTTTTQDEEDVM